MSLQPAFIRLTARSGPIFTLKLQARSHGVAHCSKLSVNTRWLLKQVWVWNSAPGGLDVVDVARQRKPRHAVHEEALPQCRPLPRFACSTVLC